MSRARPLLLLCALLLVVGGCIRRRTELVLGVATDLTAPDALDRVHLSVRGEGLPAIEEDWTLSGATGQPFNLPGSIGIYPEEPDAAPTVKIILSGFLSGTEIVRRSATLTMRARETLFFRMALVASCRKRDGNGDGVTDDRCLPGETCIEGACTTEEVDARLLPRYRDSSFPLEQAAQCQSRTQLINTAGRIPLFLTGQGACSDNERCIESICYPVAPHCFNQDKDEDETDVDCGGADCAGCVGTRDCKKDRDCLTGSCNGPNENPPEECTTNIAFRRIPIGFADSGPVLLATGDYDGDNRADVFAVYANSGRIYAYHTELDDREIQFIEGGSHAIDNPVAFTVADLDGNRTADVAIATRGLDGSGGIEVFRAMGLTPFQEMESYPFSDTRPAAITSGDLDGDGAPELVTANPDTDDVRIFWNKGAGKFDLADVSVYDVGQEPISVAIADLNGDHKPDLVVASTDPLGLDSHVGVLLNQGSHVFQRPMRFRAGTDLRALTAVDLDGDDRIDVAVLDVASGSVNILFNQTPQPPEIDPPLSSVLLQPPMSHPVGVGPAALVAGDFEHDTTEDLVVAIRSSGTINILGDHEEGEFLQILSYSAGTNARALATANFDDDNDGDDDDELGDLVVATDNGLAILLNLPN
jgi:hypothetical protein